MKLRRHPFWIAGGISLCCLATTSPTLAQIVPDATLPNNSNVTPVGNTSIITGGTRAGGNLFHSFEEFSVPTGSAAYFNNALDIQNIISRVTGASVSNIDGLLRANGKANLFLLNPNGIIFGPNASLNIGGSFLASTASSLNFADGNQFSATAHPTTPLLTVSVPLGLQFGGDVESIINRSVAVDSSGIPVGLQVDPGKTLALVGGDVALEGGYLAAPAGRIELGSVASPSFVSLTPIEKGWVLGYEGVQNFRDIQLSQGAFVSASGEGGGDIKVQGRRVTLTDGSVIAALSRNLSGGTLTVNASQSVELIGTRADGLVSSGLRTDTFGSGKAGDVRITTGKLIVRSGARVATFTYSSGSGGALDVIASDSVELSGTTPNGQPSGLFAATMDSGNAGDLTIETGELFVQNGATASVSSRTQESGDAGNLNVTAGSIWLNNQAALTAESLGSGNQGNINIDTDILTAVENSDIIASNSAGPGANIEISTQGFFLSPGSEVIASGSTSIERAVEVENPEVLPEKLVDVTGLIVQGCPAGGGTVGRGASEFIVTGRGGLPPSPNEALSSDAVVVGLVTPTQLAEIPPSSPKSTNSTSPTPDTIVEATGWAIAPKGEIVLTATAPTEPITPGLPSIDQLVQQGKTLYEAEQFSESASVWRQAAAAFKATGDELRQAMTLSNLSLAYQQLGQWPQATEAITESLKLLQTGRNISTSKERIHKAPGLASLRLRLARSQLLAQTLDIQGRLQLAQGQAYSALTTWMAAADTYAQIGDKAGVIRSRINSAQALQALGLYRQAQKTLTESTQLLQNQPDSPLKATGLRSLGNVLRVVGDLKESRQVLEQSLEVAKRTQSPQAITDALLSLGNTARAQQNTQAALKFYQQAATASASHSTRIQAQLNQLSLLLDTKQLNAAKALLPQIQSQIATLPPSRTAVYARINFAQSLMKLGSRELLAGTSRVFGAAQRVGASLPRSTSGAPAPSFTDKLGGKQKIQVNPPSKEQGRRGGFYRQTWGETENSSKPALKGALEQADHPITPSHATRLNGGNRSMQVAPHHPITRHEAQRREPEHASGSPSPHPLLTTAVQQAKDLGDQRATSYALGNLGELYEQTQQWSDAQDLTQQALFVAQAIDAPDIAYRWQWQMGRLLRNRGNIQAAIAAYTEAVNNIKSLRSDLVAINPEVQFEFRDEVEPVYRQLVDLLLQTDGTSAPSPKNLQQAREVIESLQLAELENFLQCSLQDAKGVQIDQVVNQDNQTAAVIYPIILEDRLEVILKLPKQPLRHYTTLIPQSEVEVTLEQLRHNLELPYTFQEVSSLSQRVYDWLIQPVEADLAQNGVETLVFVLDGSLRNIPIAALYDGKHYLVEKYGVALTPSLQLLDPKPLERTQLKTLTAGLTPAREVLGQYFPPLPTVERELDLIKSEVPSVTLLNQEFTTQALQKQINNRPFSVIHLATHAQFSSNPDQTFILAWDKLINVKELDELLQSRNQSRLDPIELLVLSACETADGDKRAALGLAGIAVRAGARSTLASLWAVEDASVADFMGQFYQVLANPTVNKAEALRRAQLVLLQQPQYRHPFYWAPYVLLGNWL